MKFFLRVFVAAVAATSVASHVSASSSPLPITLPSTTVCAASTAPIIPGSIVGPESCRVGQKGPGGGIIFYDAGKLEWWGRYLEAVPLVQQANATWSSASQSQTSLYTGDAATVQRQRIDAKAIGMGAVNTALIVAQSGPGVYAAARVSNLKVNGVDDWFLPSKDELNALYNFKALNSSSAPFLPSGPVWSSTEAWKNIAWYQLFEDGTQFSDSYLLASKGGNKKRTTNIKYPGTGFESKPYSVVAVRSFPQGSGTIPPTSSPVLTGKSCPNSGPCAVGDTGPAGGVVFYDAGEHKPWGRYLEVSPKAAEVIGWPWRRPGYEPTVDLIYDEKTEPSRIKRVKSKFIGMGAANTQRIVSVYGAGRYAARAAWDYSVNGYDDWFLPSADELDVMYNVLYANAEPLISFAPTYYWSSSEYDLKNAWTVLFRSGQRFDREGWFTSKDTGKPNAMRVRPIRAFG